MKTAQFARIGFRILWCRCQILAGLANMNLQSSDSAPIVWLIVSLVSSEWLRASSHSLLEAGLQIWLDLNPLNFLVVSCPAVQHSHFHSVSIYNIRSFHDLIQAITYMNTLLYL